jgi:hypothetical protein
MAAYKEIHLFGYGGCLGLGTFAQILKEIFEDTEVGGAQTQFRWSWEGKVHSGSRGFIGDDEDIMFSLCQMEAPWGC